MDGTLRNLLCVTAILVSLSAGQQTQQTEYAFVSDSDKRTIWQMDLSDTSKALVHRAYTISRYSPSYLACDTKSQYIYWVDNRNMKIKKMSVVKNGTSGYGSVLSFDFMNTMGGLAIDENARLVFFTDVTEKKIGVISIRGGASYYSFIAQNLSQPTGIAVDPQNRLLYWSDPLKQTIEVSNYDGTNRRVVLQGHLNGTRAMTYDQIGHTLYWCDSVTHRIESYNVTLAERSIVANFTSLNKTINMCQQIAVDNEKIYYISNEKNHIMYMNKMNVSDMGQLDDVADFGKLGGLTLCKDDLLYKGPTQCDENNGGCQFICLPVGQKDVKCHCTHGRRLLQDAKNCTIGRYNHGTSLLYNTYISSATRINGIEFHPDKWFDAPYVPRPFYMYGYGLNLYDMDLYYAKKSIVAFDREEKRIVSISMDGTEKIDTIYDGTSNEVHGVAVDWVHGNVYWTDTAYNWIMMAKLEPDTKFYRAVVDTNLEKPWGIAVHPMKGYIFWADNINSDDLYKSRKIERSDLDGNVRVAIVTSRLYSPQALTIDYEGDRVCFTNLAMVECVNYTGGERTTVLRLNSYGTHFTGMTFYHGYLFIADYRSSAYFSPRLIFWRIRDRSGFYMSTTYKTHGVVMYAEDRQPKQPNVCFNKGCAGLCVRTTQGTHSCLCQEGFMLDNDKRNCMEVSKPTGPFYAISYGSQVALVPTTNTLDKTFILSNDFPNPVNKNWTRVDSNFYQEALYLVNSAADTIDLMKINDMNSVTSVVKNVANVTDLSVDWVSNTLYWLDGFYGQVWISKLDGTFQTLLIDGLKKPTSIAVDPINKYLYYTVSGVGIKRSHMDGTNSITFNPTANPIQSLSIDYLDWRLYYVSTYIHYSKLDSIPHRRSFKISSFIPIAVTTFQDFSPIIAKSKTPGGAAILVKVDLEGKTYVKNPRTPVNLTDAYDIATYSSTNQPRPKGDLCDKPYSEGGCEQLCFGKPNKRTFVCKCTFGLKLDKDNRTCVAAEPMMKGGFLQVSSETRGVFQINVTNQSKVSGVKTNPTAMMTKTVYDAKHNHIYWIDGLNVKRSVSNDTTRVITVRTDAGAMYSDLAFDPNSRIIYVVDSKQEKVLAYSVHTRQWKTVLAKPKINKPLSIALHPRTRAMYIGLSGSIVKATMDGEVNSTVVQRVQAPVAIAVDIPPKPPRNRRDSPIATAPDAIYFTDRSQVQMMALEGVNPQKTIVRELNRNEETRGLTVVGNKIYVTVPTRRGVLVIDKRSHYSWEILGQVLSGLSHVFYVPPLSNDTINNCSKHNGGCSHFCFATFDPQVTSGRVCGCPDYVRFEAGTDNCEGTKRCNHIIPRGFLDDGCTRKPGDSCIFWCAPGHTKDVQKITCSSTGVWSPSITTLCQPDCKLFDYTNAEFVRSCSKKVGSTCELRCQKGMQKWSGTEKRTCTFDPNTGTSSWTGERLICGVPTTKMSTTTKKVTTTTTTPPQVYTKKPIPSVNNISPKAGANRQDLPKALEGGTVAAIVVSVIVAIVLIAVVAFFLWKRYWPVYRSKRYEQHTDEGNASVYDAAEVPNVMYQSPDHLSFGNPLYDTVQGAQARDINPNFDAKDSRPEVHFGPDMTGLPEKGVAETRNVGGEMESGTLGGDSYLPPIETPRIEINTQLRGERSDSTA